MKSTSIGCNQWLSLTKIALKVPHVDRNRSLVARTNMCGDSVSISFIRISINPSPPPNHHHLKVKKQQKEKQQNNNKSLNRIE